MNGPDFIQNIRLDRLVKSPRNVRKTPSSGAADAELKASIAVHGLQQNLVVTPANGDRSEEHTSELPSLMRTSYAVFCLTKKPNINNTHPEQHHVVSLAPLCYT